MLQMERMEQWIGDIPERAERPIAPLMYPDEASACAVFIQLELEDIRKRSL
jgi:hypothetical protein